MSSFLSMTEARLPPGFRFHPRDEELVCDYLEKKAAAGNNGGSHACPMMIDVDLNKCEPWELPEMACVGGKEWFFFNLRDRKYATGQRTNRATQSGYWKATGKDRQVRRKGVLVGMRKTLVFYRGRAPKGKKTDWVMHEFRMESTHPSTFPPLQEDWVLCRVFYKSRPTVTSQQTMQTSYDDTNSSSLPPLMDTFFAFDQAASSSLEENQQVPCFSDLPPSLVSPRDLAAPPISLVERSHADGLPNSGSCDEKVLKLVLNHFKLEGISDKQFPPNLPQGSLEGYLTDNGLSHIWNSF